MTATVYSYRMKVTFDRPTMNVRFQPSEPEPETEGYSYLNTISPYVTNEDESNKTQSSYGRKRASDGLRLEIVFLNNDQSKLQSLKQMFDTTNNNLDQARVFWSENSITVSAGEIEQGSFENIFFEHLKNIPHPIGSALTPEQMEENRIYMEQISTF